MLESLRVVRPLSFPLALARFTPGEGRRLHGRSKRFKVLFLIIEFKAGPPRIVSTDR